MATKTKKLIRTEPLTGYAMRVGGPHPYIAVGQIRTEICTENYHEIVPVVQMTLADYRRLYKAAKVKP